MKKCKTYTTYSSDEIFDEKVLYTEQGRRDRSPKQYGDLAPDRTARHLI